MQKVKQNEGAKKNSEIINALCIDLEPWYSPEFVRNNLPEIKGGSEDQIVESVSLILDLLDNFNIKVTFAVLGIVAEQHPELIRTIYEKGHEVASHAYSHKTLYELGKVKFEQEILRSIELLQSITGEKPIGFRAPSFSINNSTKWAFEILLEQGFRYDASVFPIKTILYGVPDAPLHIYKPSMLDVSKENPDGEIIEFPMTVLNIGTNIPIAGGFYLRVLPLWFLSWAIRRVNKRRPAIIYIHSWEVYPKTPRLRNIPALSRFITYYGINSVIAKVEKLLEQFRFGRVRDVLSL